MTYKAALKRSNGQASTMDKDGLPYLAMAISLAAIAHPGVSQEMLFEAAKRNHVSGKAVSAMSAEQLSELMFL